MAQINKPSDYFNTLLRNGTGTGNTAVTGVGFQPDLVWQKRRNTTGNHFWTDSVRGSSKKIYSNTTDAEDTDANWVVSFDSDGYTMGSSDYGTSDTVASWNWLAGGTASSNTDGSITSSVSANTTAGFSIVKYTGNATSGATVGHGLGVVPKMILVKNLDAAENWSVYHDSIGNTKFLRLNQTNATTTSSTIWNDTTPTSSVFTVGNGASVNGSGNDLIAYCFAEKKGYSKFGSYTGNGSTDGTFIFCGFKPAYVLTKSSSDGTKHWVCWDNKRANTYNPQNERILTNTSNVAYESDTRAIDFLSNGFKMRDNGTDSSSANSSGSTQIYMAFAEQPLVGTNNIPCTAR